MHEDLTEKIIGAAMEIKAIKELKRAQIAQLLNCLKATKLILGLLLNFGATSLQYKRVLTNLYT